MIELKKEDAIILPEGVNLAEFRGKENVVVIAPHPDDDAIGVGGSIKLLTDKDENVFTIYVTTGSGTSAAGRRSPATVTKDRQAESEKALKTLGMRAGFFLHYESKEVNETQIEDVSQDIFAVLMLLRPKLIYIPSPFELHSDHIAVTQRTLEAIKKVPQLEVKLRGYSVWGSIFAAKDALEFIDISNVVDAKKRAIRCHTSEIKSKAYDEAEIGVNKYNAVQLYPHEPKPLPDYVEVLLNMDELVLRPELELDVYARNLALKNLHDIYENLVVAGKDEIEL